MKTEEDRRKMVRGALAFTEGTPAEAGEYERYLLEKYVQGLLTIDEVIVLLHAEKASL